MAVSRVRVEFGAFPLALSLILLGCLVSPKRLLTSLTVLATTVAVNQPPACQGDTGLSKLAGR